MSQPKQEQINTVIASKKRIADLTGKILDALYDSKSGAGLEEKQELLIKKYVNEVVSELSTIAGFATSRERDFVTNMTDRIFMVTQFVESTAPLLEDWCTMVNGITVDFNSTPFRFFDSDLRSKWGKLENKISVLVRR